MIPLTSLCRAQIPWKRFLSTKPIPAFQYQPLFQASGDSLTPYRCLGQEGIKSIQILGQEAIHVSPAAITKLTQQAFIDMSHLLRPAHLQQLSNIVKDEAASDNDRFVALQLLQNADIAAEMVLPGCQDTGTAIIMGKRGSHVFTEVIT